MKKRVAYYNMPGDITYEQQLLSEWNVDGIQLEEVKGNQLIHDLQGYQGLVTEYTVITEENLRQLPELEIIALQSIGYDEIDVKAARKCNIDVTNAPGYCAEDVATHAMALLLSIVRQITLFDKEVHDGIWNPFAGNVMHRLSGRTAGLISFGNIPQRLVPMLKGFGIRIVSYDPVVEEDFMKERGVEKCGTLQDALEQSDFVFLHTPLLPETRHMMNEQSIAYMKPDAILINVARGALVEEKALLKALQEKKILAAGLDVLEGTYKEELLALPNAIITPHVAFLSEDSLMQSRRMALEQLVMKLVQGDTPTLLVNR